MQIASSLWAAGIKAEFGYKANPKMGDQLNYALEEVGGRLADQPAWSTPVRHSSIT
jgi:hypothetical protein